jgi:hypothetical protein
MPEPDEVRLRHRREAGEQSGRGAPVASRGAIGIVNARAAEGMTRNDTRPPWCQADIKRRLAKLGQSPSVRSAEPAGHPGRRPRSGGAQAAECVVGQKGSSGPRGDRNGSAGIRSLLRKARPEAASRGNGAPLPPRLKERQMCLIIFAATLAAAICLNVISLMMQNNNFSVFRIIG